MADNDPPLFNTNVSVILIAMGSAAFVVTMYHLIAVCLCSRHFTDQNSDQPPPPHQNILVAGATAQMPSINETSVAHLIPAHKYKKKVDDDVAGDHKDNGGDDATCAVCLGDFEEGEELRTLPACSHSFHVPCIDMWLYSHPSCPVCRTNATPSPAVNHCVPEYVPGESNAHDHRIDIGQIALVQNGSMQR